jgi:hypothetical protein
MTSPARILAAVDSSDRSRVSPANKKEVVDPHP